MQKQHEDAVLRVLRESFDGSEASITRTLKRIGKVLRSAQTEKVDPRQMRLMEEAFDAKSVA